ncbi:hypothetical protein SBA5_290006 [Candidatus Sulfotelmatomonas gaucii]|uniref:Uncharacterized protein n=1 Tax=Candidatus Sulfuritelmatomonas gaucii TaxID=2043161 RepID=A0A2N9LA25_9BACT|nr:hypothetical protein SBA5_290006 [Candidatus Sulfotelmatomonas gaucii]
MFAVMTIGAQTWRFLDWLIHDTCGRQRGPGMGKAGSTGPWAIVHTPPRTAVLRLRLLAAMNDSLKIPTNQCVI